MKKRGITQPDSPDRLNVIVDGSKIIGDILTESNLRIDGEIQGNVSSASKVVVGATGIIIGNLTCLDADIEGSIEGILKIDNLLSLRSKAVINGEITTAKFQVEEGATFTGTCRMSNFSTSTTASYSTTQEDTVY